CVIPRPPSRTRHRERHEAKKWTDRSPSARVRSQRGTGLAYCPPKRPPRSSVDRDVVAWGDVVGLMTRTSSRWERGGSRRRRGRCAKRENATKPLDRSRRTAGPGTRELGHAPQIGRAHV